MSSFGPRNVYSFVKSRYLLWRYMAGGNIAWSAGYGAYHARRVVESLHNPAIIDAFAGNAPLPKGYGSGLDERIVEYPWVFSRLGNDGSLVLDAGSTFNHPHILQLTPLMGRKIVIASLAFDYRSGRSGDVYAVSDLRKCPFKEGSVSTILCVSALEHIGMDNTKIYTSDSRFAEVSPYDYRKVMAEFSRILPSRGRLLLTVPYGRALNLGWMLQFDAAGIDDASSAFGARPRSAAYYRYRVGGWESSTPDQCADAVYFDVHSARSPAADGAAAARAVACLEYVKGP